MTKCTIWLTTYGKNLVRGQNTLGTPHYALPERSRTSPFHWQKQSFFQWWCHERTRSYKRRRSMPPPTRPPHLRLTSLPDLGIWSWMSRNSQKVSWKTICGSEDRPSRTALPRCRLSSRWITVRGLWMWAHYIVPQTIRTGSGFISGWLEAAEMLAGALKVQQLFPEAGTFRNPANIHL